MLKDIRYYILCFSIFGVFFIFFFSLFFICIHNQLEIDNFKYYEIHMLIFFVLVTNLLWLVTISTLSYVTEYTYKASAFTFVFLFFIYSAILFLNPYYDQLIANFLLVFLSSDDWIAESLDPMVLVFFDYLSSNKFPFFHFVSQSIEIQIWNEDDDDIFIYICIRDKYIFFCYFLIFCTKLIFLLFLLYFYLNFAILLDIQIK